VLYDLEKDPFVAPTLPPTAPAALMADMDSRIAAHMAAMDDDWVRRFDRPFR
jgi:hypothetical protein